MSFVTSQTGRGHEQAIRLHEDWNRTVAGIQNNSQLSDTGRQQQMAVGFKKYREALSQVRTTAAEQTQRRAADLTRQAFGIPSDALGAMSYRDALGRAEAIEDPRVAARKMEQSLETGDTLMAKALARHASDNGWSDVLDAYAAAAPSAGAALSELQKIQSDQSDFSLKISDGAHFSAQKPAEISGMTDTQIDYIASQAETGAA